MAAARRCFYFAYGSNLSSWRININVPSAVFHRIGYVEGYELSFRSLTREPTGGAWRGAVATILACQDSVATYGVVWSIAEEEVSSLDAQEIGYRPISVRIKTDTDEEPIVCRTYVHKEVLPFDPAVDRPSPQYLDCITSGAVEQGLPKEYVSALRKIDDNGYTGMVDIKRK